MTDERVNALADEAVQRVHLRSHLQVLAVGWLVYVADVALSAAHVWGYGGDTPLRWVVVVLGAAFLVRLSLRRRVSRRWEVAGFSLLTVAMLAHAGLAVYGEGLSARTLLSSGLWLYLIYIYAFTVLSAGGARWFAGGTWAAVTALALPAAAAPTTGREALAALAQYQGGGLVAIVLASALASWRSALGAAQLRAEEAERRSLTDILTGQPNRRALQLEIHREIARSRRTGLPFSLMLLDVDRFKALNDRHGHAAGDAVLMEIARVARACLRAEDDLGRWGGEEFVVVAPSTGPDQALRLAERLRARLERYDWAVEAVTASLGVTTYRRGDTLERLFERADAALYRAKELGRNRCELELARGAKGGTP